MTKRFRFRWGIPEWDVGSTDIPNPIFQYYSRVPWKDQDGKEGVGISNQEAMFILHLASFRYESPKGKASPALTTTLRTRMGYSTEQGVINVMQKLEHKGLLMVHRSSGKRSVYDFINFSKAIMDMWQADNPSTGVEGYTPVDSYPSTGVEDHPSTGVYPKKKKEEEPKSEEEEIIEAIISDSSGRPGPLDLALVTEKARKRDGGVWTVPLEADGENALAQSCLTYFYEERGATLPSGNAYDAELRVIAKALAQEHVTEQDVADEAIGLLFDRKGDWGFRKGNFKIMDRNFPNDLAMALRIAKQGLAEVEEEDWTEPYEPGDEEPVAILEPTPPKPMSETERIWCAALGELQLQMTKAPFETWVKDTRLISHDNGNMVVEVRDALSKDWLDNRLRATMERILVGIVGGEVAIEFIVST